MQAIMPIPLYLTNPLLTSLLTKITSKPSPSKLTLLSTIFHLQGGGQPNDRGLLRKGQKQFPILGGSIDRQSGVIEYQVGGDAAELAVGDEVLMEIDAQVRKLNMRIHSAGHLLDLAVHRLKYGWQAGKGYHFPDSPYVEYKVQKIPPNLQSLIAPLNAQLVNLFAEQPKTKSTIYSYAEAVQSKIIPQTFKVPFVRMMQIGQTGCPCGGTHVENITQIGGIQVCKIAKKGKNIRVSYIVK